MFVLVKGYGDEVVILLASRSEIGAKLALQQVVEDTVTLDDDYHYDGSQFFFQDTIYAIQELEPEHAISASSFTETVRKSML